jgi:hypothetical protein
VRLRRRLGVVVGLGVIGLAIAIPATDATRHVPDGGIAVVLISLGLYGAWTFARRPLSRADVRATEATGFGWLLSKALPPGALRVVLFLLALLMTAMGVVAALLALGVVEE